MTLTLTLTLTHYKAAGPHALQCHRARVQVAGSRQGGLAPFAHAAMSASAVAWPLDGDEARAAGLAHVTDVIDRIAKKDMVVVAGGTPAPLHRYTPAAADVVLSDATDPSLGIKYTCPGCDATVSVTSMNSKGMNTAAFIMSSMN